MEVIAMIETKVLTKDVSNLLQAWQETLPTLLKASDECKVQADAKDSDTLLIHIANAGRTHYSVDFRCKYVDDREVHVEVLDVEKDHVAVDVNTDIIQSIIQDYMRNIHECAQRVRGMTK